MRPSTADSLSTVLDFLRSFEGLTKDRQTQFLLNGKNFIHFHDENDGIWADVFFSAGRKRRLVNFHFEHAVD